MDNNGQLGILVVGHGSPRREANDGFIALVGRIAGRLGGVTVLPTFFSIARPSIEDRVAELASQGVRRVVLLPYFLYSGQHVTGDIPELLAKCRREHPQLDISVLPTLENEPLLEDLLVDRLADLLPAMELPPGGKAIEARSHAIIESQIGPLEAADPARRAVVRRIIHATADLSLGRSLRIHPQAIQRGLEAIRTRRPIICDVKMVVAGITKVDCPKLCAIGDADVIARSGPGLTRAAAAIEKLADQLDGSIVAVGNAPTALWKLMEIARAGGPRPALVVGLPVGFVGARESKLALIDSGLCYIANTTARGGSPAACAAVNALATLASAHGAAAGQ